MNTGSLLSVLIFAAVIAACSPAPDPSVSATPVAFETSPAASRAPTRLDFDLLTGTPEALEALQAGETHFVSFALPAGQLPNVRRGDTWAPLSPDCAHGPVFGLDEIALPSGSNHLIVSVVPGDPESHAANLAACDYRMPGTASDPPADPVQFRVEGCFRVHEVSIPTARQLVFLPRAAEACEK